MTFGPPLELPGADDLPRAQRARVVTERLTEAFRDAARVRGGGHVEPRCR